MFALPVMRLSLQMCAVLLGVLWMPLTAHCALERVGLLEHSEVCETHPDVCSEQEGRCGHDNCDLVENGLYRTVLSSLIVPPPTEAVEPWSGELTPEALPVAARVPWHVGSTDDPSNWLPSWVFNRRIAAPARAPGYLS